MLFGLVFTIKPWSCNEFTYEALCVIWYHLYNLKSLKNTHGGVFFVVKLQALAYNLTKNNTPPWEFFTFFNLYKWYQIAQSITYAFWAQWKYLKCLANLKMVKYNFFCGTFCLFDLFYLEKLVLISRRHLGLRNTCCIISEWKKQRKQSIVPKILCERILWRIPNQKYHQQ